MEASRLARLCRRACTNITPTESQYDRGISGGQVNGLVLVDSPHFRLDRIERAPDAATLVAYAGALLVLPLAGEVSAKDGSVSASAGERLVADSVASLDFNAAAVTLLTRGL